MAPVKFEIVQEHIALVTIQRPDVRNSVNLEVAQGLDAAVKRVEADPEIRVAILTGAGGAAFCAGADLNLVAAGQIDDLYTPDGQFAGFVCHPRKTPWIAAVDGFAMAGGCEIALACDMIVASENSVFGLPEVTRGLVAAAGGVYRVVRAMPRAIAMELLATADRLPAARAAELGLVNHLAEPGKAVERAIELAARIAANAPVAVQESLQLAREAFDHDDATLFAMGLAAQDRIKLTEDFAEGPRAFIEKRAPQWKGR